MGVLGTIVYYVLLIIVGVIVVGVLGRLATRAPALLLLVLAVVGFLIAKAV